MPLSFFVLLAFYQSHERTAFSLAGELPAASAIILFSFGKNSWEMATYLTVIGGWAPWLSTYQLLWLLLIIA